MEKAKLARKAETLKQPSLGLRLRAPYLYPDRVYSATFTFLFLSPSELEALQEYYPVVPLQAPYLCVAQA
jgi:hypothetical protein